MPTTSFTDVRAVLRQSHDELATTVAAMGEAQVSGPSYCAEWTIGRVLSHLGSGAEISASTILAARADGDARETDNQAIWARWDALDDPAAAAEYIRSEEALIALVESIAPAEAEALQVPFFTGPIALADFLAMRLSEHTFHRWDVDVVTDPAAELNTAATGFMLAAQAQLVPYLAKPDQAPDLAGLVLAFDLGGQGTYTLDLREGVTFTADAPETPDATVTLPVDAFLRLLFGRLDEAHVPAGITVDGKASLDSLRRLLPGF
jgi:uncharacterized protein (TIGR03083 family)